MTPSCIAAMNRGGRETILSTSRARRLPCCCSSTIFVLRAVTRPYSAATKNAFRSSEPDKGGQLEGDSHAPVSPGAQVLGGRSSSKLARSIGNGSDVLDAFGALLEHEPLEVGERLRDREAA